MSEQTQNQDRDQGPADESDIKAAYAAACNTFSAASMFVAGQNVMIGSVLLSAMAIGKLRAEAKADPNSYVGTLLPLLEREAARITEEAVIGRARSLKDPTDDGWNPLQTAAERGGLSDR